MLPWALVPTHTGHYQATILTPKVQYLFPGKIYDVELGLYVCDIPENNVIQLKEILPGLTILNKFWTSGTDFLKIHLITDLHIYLNVGDPICKVFLTDTKSLLPGKRNFGTH